MRPLPNFFALLVGAVVVPALGAVSSADSGRSAPATVDAASSVAEGDRPERARWGWSVFSGVHRFSDSSSLGDGRESSVASAVLVGGRIYQELGPGLTVEGELPLGLSSSHDHRATLLVSMPRVHGRFSPWTGRVASPSILLGLGFPIVTSTRQSSVPSDIQPALYAGLGLKFRSKRLQVGLETRYIAMRSSGGGAPSADWEALVTFSLRGKSGVSGAAPLVLDLDGDGVPDEADQCPRRREDMDGFQDEDGCPELDNDNDGVIDGLDLCQGQAETFNGYQDDDGCPDEVDEAVRLLDGALVGVHFDAGSAVMEEGGLDELNALAGVLKANPSIGIKLYGHADDREAKTADALEALALERAESVRQYLIEQGVGFGRVIAFSRASTQPLADNLTAGGRRANRRVEVKLNRDQAEEANTR